jgi:hypothetical protein
MRAETLVTVDGNPSLSVRSADGQNVASLFITGSGGGVWLGSESKPRGQLLFDDRKTRLVLSDREGRERSAFFINNAIANGDPGMVFSDEQKTTRAVFGLREGAPALVLYDTHGIVRSVLGRADLAHTNTGSTEIRPESYLVMFDPQGKMLWMQP